MKKIISFFVLFLFSIPAFGLVSDLPLTDAALEGRARALFHEIRCVVCQSEAISDSHAEVAKDIRYNIRRWIESGISDEEIKSKLTAQYGNVILMKPPLERGTVLLWFGPWLILIVGGISLYFYFRRGLRRKL